MTEEAVTRNGADHNAARRARRRADERVKNEREKKKERHAAKDEDRMIGRQFHAVEKSERGKGGAKRH